MKAKPYPALCRDCKHSVPAKDSAWTLRCTHPVVNANDPWALASVTAEGTNCQTEREGRWLFAKCGMPGLLWETK